MRKPRFALLWLVFWCVAAPLAIAQDLSGLARVEVSQSVARDGQDGPEITLAMTQGVPYRVYSLAEPYRLVVDFREVDWQGFDTDAFDQSDGISTVRAGAFRPGWSRLVVELTGPYGIETVALATDTETGSAVLNLALADVSESEFAEAAGAPRDPRWDLPEASMRAAEPPAEDGVLRVMLDPGHGGIDPGAERDDVTEKDLMLTFARELEESMLRAGGFEVFFTRTGDYFVSLERRIAMAHDVEADLFLSLHADALADGGAHGATVYVLSEEASDVASAKLAERHDRDQLLSGVDLSTTDDQVTSVLLDLERQETAPRTDMLAAALVTGMGNKGGPMNRRPLRQAAFSVLKAADIPSVLIEIGFLSSPRDLKNLQDAEWRAQMADGVRDGVQMWMREDREMRPLVRN